MAVPIRLESGEDLSALCFEADVFCADSKVDNHRLRVGPEPGAGAQQATVRIHSAAAVDEPVVTIYLRVGCAQNITRRYVLLADVASEGPTTAVSAPLASIAAAKAAGSPGPALVGAAVREDVAASSVLPPAGVKLPAADKPARPKAEVPARSTQLSVARRPGPAGAPKSRLKLDQLDFLAERDPVLKASAELLTAPADDESKRTEAAALWRAINAQPQDVLRDAQRLQALEADVQALRAQNVKNQAGIGELTAQLRRAEGERHANGLVYSLIVLLVGVSVAAAYFWSRARKGLGGVGDWWQGADRGWSAHDEPDSVAAMPVAAGPLDDPARWRTEIDVDLDVNESMFESLKKAQPAQPDFGRPKVLPVFEVVDFASSFSGSGRAVNTEELFDIHQQADFFVSLGQHEQAIAVLKNHIADSVDTSPLAYLDLLNVYRAIGRTEDYGRLRDDFNRVFNAQVPVFEAFSEESKGLEAYQGALSRVEALWPSAKVLEVIEESIFRRPDTGEGEAFALEAYREWLLLFAVAKEVVEPEHESGDFEFSVDSETDSSAPPAPVLKFSPTAIEPLSVSVPQRTVPIASSDLATPPLSPRLGLDIDLSEPDLGVPIPAPEAWDPREGDGAALARSVGDKMTANGHRPDFDVVDSSLDARRASKTNRR
ncbi:MAG: hypothetical protein ACRECD_13325 [Burkholderiaceae bacterium]